MSTAVEYLESLFAKRSRRLHLFERGKTSSSERKLSTLIDKQVSQSTNGDMSIMQSKRLL